MTSRLCVHFVQTTDNCSDGKCTQISIPCWGRGGMDSTTCNKRRTEFLRLSTMPAKRIWVLEAKLQAFVDLCVTRRCEVKLIHESPESFSYVDLGVFVSGVRTQFQSWGHCPTTLRKSLWRDLKEIKGLTWGRRSATTETTPLLVRPVMWSWSLGRLTTENIKRKYQPS